ncbi:unnamed protein product [Didymodactylos carnosus]|uniref:Uncharacterized protein n=1 Tax=Didymodactylos carnosus TaxID=1234261 RepID=A0A813WLV6_9BILA|nr:unnamed protein product [Didymodactylos carnosus]CAF3644568.1 unnamed protein product [Didymodactylos carnosus]CAF4490888.1 unnamed protein product [Didymodactylos carnosus]
MLSYTQIIYVTGFVLCVLCYDHVSSLETTSIFDQAEQLSDLTKDHKPLHVILGLSKRRADSNSRIALPLFRGSNLGIFVRKRPRANYSMKKRAERLADSSLVDEDTFSDLLVKNYRRHEYDDSAGPMFG